MSRTVETVASGSFIFGLLLGFVVEGHTNEVAAKKANTAEVCMEKMGERAVMNHVDVTCIETGNGTYEAMIDPRKLPSGTTKEELFQYSVGQHQEAESLETRRLVGWAFAGTTELIFPTLAYQYIAD